LKVLLSSNTLVVVTVTTVKQEGCPVPNRTVQDFIVALEKDKLLRDAVNFQHSMVNVARLWTQDATITGADIEKAIKEKWGVDSFTCISKACLSEVPGL
jgi:hypothetical protein